MPRIFRHTSHPRQPVTEQQIANRAYALWQARGCPAGDGTDDWQTAEAQLVAETLQPHPRPGILHRFITRIRQRAA